tara:strand:- start:1192 stop:1410 length:219 start_codon:yes stop_codon:yes gene_type:complete
MSLIKHYLQEYYLPKEPETMNQLEMLTQREQLMEDIDSIVEEHSYYSNMSAEKVEDLIRVLCDAVIKNFPTK